MSDKNSIFPNWLRGFGERAEYKLSSRDWRTFEKVADHIESLEREKEQLRELLREIAPTVDLIQRIDEALR